MDVIWHCHTIDSKKATELAASCNKILQYRYENIGNHKTFERSENIGAQTLFKKRIRHITSF